MTMKFKKNLLSFVEVGGEANKVGARMDSKWGEEN